MDGRYVGCTWRALHAAGAWLHRCALGIVVWHPDDACFYVSALPIEGELLSLAFGDKSTYIGPAELLAVLAATETYSDKLADRDVVCFVDNQGSLGNLVSGSSSDRACGRMRMAHEARRSARVCTCDSAPASSMSM